MSENWKFQLSLKIENHLLNIRADTVEEFVQAVTDVEASKEPLLLAIAQICPEKPQQARPALTPGRAPVVPPGASVRELGPFQLEGVEVKKAGRDLVPFKNPLYIVKWEGGSATTFDTLIGKAAMGFWSQGHPCYVTVEPSPKNPKYTNLLSIRMAA